MTKTELTAELPHCVEVYDGVETVPHYPPIENYYYMRPHRQTGDGSYLDRFLEYFNPLTEVDRQLITALIMTTFLRGQCGKRKPFIIKSCGTGAGKTTLAEKIASISGRSYSFDKNTKPEDILRALINTADNYSLIAINKPIVHRTDIERR